MKNRNWHPKQIAYWRDQMRKREALHRAPVTYSSCHTCGLKTRMWDCYICQQSKDPIYRDPSCLLLLAKAGAMG